MFVAYLNIERSEQRFHILAGLILVPNGEHIGYVFGDTSFRTNETISLGHRTTAKLPEEITPGPIGRASSHSWGIFFTILGTVLLDFDADACQSPARAYLLDVTVPGNFNNDADTSIFKTLKNFYRYYFQLQFINAFQISDPYRHAVYKTEKCI